LAKPININSVAQKANSIKNKAERSDAVMAPDTKSMYNKEIVTIELATQKNTKKIKLPQNLAKHPLSEELSVDIFLFNLIVGK
jgi:hypothetical protein